MEDYAIGSIINNPSFKASGGKPAVNFPIKLISYEEANETFQEYSSYPCNHCVFENSTEGCHNTPCTGGLWVPVETSAEGLTNTNKEEGLAELLYAFVTDKIDPAELRNQATKLLIEQGFLTFKKEV